MPNTLFGRLLLSSLLVLSAFFGVMGFAIVKVTHEKALTNKEQQLRLQNYVLLSSSDVENDQILVPEELREHRFDEFESGLYGYISDEHGNVLWRSYSAHALDMDTSLLQTGNLTPGGADFSESEQYYIYHYTVQWEVITDQPQLLTFSVLEESAPSRKEIKQFQQQLSLWLIVVGSTLIILLMIILRWGTKPLRVLAATLKQVENGSAEKLDGQYPIELRGLAKNLNDLIHTERTQRERYRATLSDLAHSLKTPLAVIQSQLQNNHKDDPQFHLMNDQTQRIDDIIKHQLQRAVITETNNLTQTHSVKTSVERITGALSKVHAHKGITFTIDIDENTLFRGDQRDLMEVLGNLLDNACKACEKKVTIYANNQDKQLIIDIHDDGSGVPLHLRETITQRGQRADTKHSGQGIGLAVTLDIIESYHGKFSIDDSSLGGALIKIRFPFASG